MSSIHRLIAALALLSASAAAAHSFNLKGIEIDHPFATPTPGGAPTGAVYVSLENRTKVADRLVGATTPRAKRVELHSMSMSGDVMRMREIASIEVKPGQKIAMQPGSGFHLMLVDLAAPLKPGDRFPLTLRFEKSGTLAVEVVVEQPRPVAIDHKH